MRLRLLLLALGLLVVPSLSFAAPPLSPAGTGDEEIGEHDSDEAAPATGGEEPAPAPKETGDEEGSSRYDRIGHRRASEEDRGPPVSRTADEPRYKSDPDYVPATRSVTLDLGGGLVSLGGYAFPKIAFSGTPDNSLRAFGLGGAFRLNYDFSAMDFDWRVGLNGATPGYMGVRGTVGISKDLSPVSVPRFVARGGVGIELMLAHVDDVATFLVPNFVGEGEVSLEFQPTKQFTIGFVVALGIRYGLPLGFGFDVTGYLPRLKYTF